MLSSFTNVVCRVKSSRGKVGVETTEVFAPNLFEKSRSRCLTKLEVDEQVEEV